MRHVTEMDLRERYGLGQGLEIRLAPDERLTPAARDFLQERRITVVMLDAHGSPVGEDGTLSHPLCLSRLGEKPPPQSQLFTASAPKPEHMTHLHATKAVSKDHPRIVLRGRLDSLIADFVLAQNELGREGEMQGQAGVVVKRCMADLRSWLGHILRAEVTEEALPPLKMATLSYEKIRDFSHYPLRFLHYDHVVPEASQGVDTARLNYLRAKTREVELCAVHTFTDAQGQVTREDVVLALNRLSSAVYVLMILVVAQRAGVTKALKEFV